MTINCVNQFHAVTFFLIWVSSHFLLLFIKLIKRKQCNILIKSHFMSLNYFLFSESCKLSAIGLIRVFKCLFRTCKSSKVVKLDDFRINLSWLPATKKNQVLIYILSIFNLKLNFNTNIKLTIFFISFRYFIYLYTSFTFICNYNKLNTFKSFK